MRVGHNSETCPTHPALWRVLIGYYLSYLIPRLTCADDSAAGRAGEKARSASGPV